MPIWPFIFSTFVFFVAGTFIGEARGKHFKYVSIVFLAIAGISLFLAGFLLLFHEPWTATPPPENVDGTAVRGAWLVYILNLFLYLGPQLSGGILIAMSLFPLYHSRIKFLLVRKGIY